MESLEKIKQLGKIVTEWGLPSEEDVLFIEKNLNIKYPKSYLDYLLNYSNIIFGFFDHLKMTVIEDFEWLYAINVINDAWDIDGVPKYLIPFIQDNGDYYCFDTRTEKDGEYSIKYWSHNGTTDEKWDNFMDWVEKCWLGEYLSSI
jgi:hypothetical protein